MTLKTGAMKNFVKQTDPYIFIAYFEKKRSGWIAYDKSTGISMLYVKPEFRKKGIGSELINALCFTTDMYGWEKPKLKPWTKASLKCFSKFKNLKKIDYYTTNVIHSYL